LRSSGPPGVPGLLDARQCLQLRQILRRGAKDYGFATDNWTLKRIRRVIEERFGVTYTTLSGVWRLLLRIGFSLQRPARTAVERDQDQIVEWVEHIWPKIVKRGPSAWPGSSSATSVGVQVPVQSRVRLDVQNQPYVGLMIGARHRRCM
jgi:hypothetical protein